MCLNAGRPYYAQVMRSCGTAPFLLVPDFRWSLHRFCTALSFCQVAECRVQLAGSGLWAKQTMTTEALHSWADN